jgi:hypothetical protein
MKEKLSGHFHIRGTIYGESVVIPLWLPNLVPDHSHRARTASAVLFFIYTTTWIPACTRMTFGNANISRARNEMRYDVDFKKSFVYVSRARNEMKYDVSF